MKKFFLNYMVAHPACAVFRGSLSFIPGATGGAQSFGSPLRVMPGNILKDRNGGHYPPLTAGGYYVKFRGGGDGGRDEFLDDGERIIIFI